MTKKERIAALEAQIAAMKHELNLLRCIIAHKQDKQPVYKQPDTWVQQNPIDPQIPDKWLKLTLGSVGQ